MHEQWRDRMGSLGKDREIKNEIFGDRQRKNADGEKEMENDTINEMWTESEMNEQQRDRNKK